MPVPAVRAWSGRVRRLCRASRLPPRELLTTLHAAAVLAVVEVLVRVVPLPRLCRLLGMHLDLAPMSGNAAQLSVTALPTTAQRQLRCTVRIADLWRFSRGPCLRRALVAGHLLRDLDPGIRLGVTGAGEDLLAHAWLEIDKRPLEDVGHYSVFHLPPTGTVG